MLWTFVPVAFLLSLTPGPGMALVVPPTSRSTSRWAAAVSRAKRTLASTGFARRVEQVTGAVLLALAGRLALDSR